MVPGLDLTNTDRKKHAYYYEMAIPVARVFDVVRKQSLEDDSIELVLLSRSTDHARSGKNQLLEHAQQRVFIEEMTAGRAYAIYEAACPRFVTEGLLQLLGRLTESVPDPLPVVSVVLCLCVLVRRHRV